MTEYEDEMAELVENYPDPAKRNAAVFKSHRQLALSLINEGFKLFEAKQRRERRNEIKKNILKPEFMNENYVRPKTIAPVTVSKRTVTGAINHAVDVFSGWTIGRLEIGKATKDKLLTAAQHERKSGAGHLVNAAIYENLAKPMNNTQTVADYWKSKEAVQLIRDEVIKNVSEGSIGFIEDRPSV